MGSVVALPRQEPVNQDDSAYQCGCGGMTFFLMRNGAVVCYDCQGFATPFRVMLVEPVAGG